MSCTMQTVNASEIQEWRVLMKEKLLTSETSILYVKRVLAVAVSTMLYNRHVFPESAFVDRKLSDFQLKILSTQTGNADAAKLIALIKSCCEALDEGYVEQIRIMFLSDDDGNCKPIEEFAFKFKYNDGIVMFECEEGFQDLDITVPRKTRESTLKTLQKMLCFDDILNPLPKKGRILITLLYNDDITPSTYEPAGFEAFDYADLPVINGATNLKCGDILTPFHKTTVTMKSTLLKKDRLAVPASGTSDQNVQEIQGSKRSEIYTDGVVKNVDVEMAEGDENNLQCPELCCPCHLNIEQEVMLQCQNCKTQQHGICYGILNAETAPNYHICVTCYQSMFPIITPPTDELLYAEECEDKQLLCILRQSMLHSLKLKEVDANILASNMHSDKAISKKVLAIMEDEGYISKKNEKYIVAHEVIYCKGLPMHFPSAVKNVSLTDNRKDENADPNKASVLDSQADFGQNDSEPKRKPRRSRSRGKALDNSKNENVVPDENASQVISNVGSSEDFVMATQSLKRKSTRNDVPAKKRKSSANKENFKYKAVARSTKI